MLHMPGMRLLRLFFPRSDPSDLIVTITILVVTGNGMSDSSVFRSIFTNVSGGQCSEDETDRGGSETDPDENHFVT
jgi:hypothetical protein